MAALKEALQLVEAPAVEAPAVREMHSFQTTLRAAVQAV
jgi:hypothetical protein